MARGPLKEETKRQRALEMAASMLAELGGTEEEIAEIKAVEAPVETVMDKIREAEAALIYFSTKGFRFKEKQCKTCGRVFAYRWEVDSISNCSLDCAKAALKQIGIIWDPHRTQAQRWGSCAPAVISPEALDVLKQRIESDSLEDQLLETSA